ncbi:MAG TPA: S8 family serine peptidase [Sphingomonas sp.]|nr:S8 family serine peptidase [Sphingomonas sp.]
MSRAWPLAIVAAFSLAAPGAAQLLPGAPQLPVSVPRLPIERPIERIQQLGGHTVERVLEQARLRRIASFVHDNRATIDRDDRGFPAVRGEILLTAPESGDLDALRQNGFAVIDDETIAGLGLRTIRLAIPHGMSLAKAVKAAHAIAGDRVSANNILFRSGEAMAADTPPVAAMAPDRAAAADPVAIGLIDGGVAATPLIPGRVTQRGFATGGPAPDRHATAVASLLIGEGKVRGADPGAHLFAADVYGRDPAGGNALAIATALGWMVENRVAVVTISLVGPPNGLLARAVQLAQDKGVTIVAAVGNDGPAAPPAYPASYPGVIAVTGVDRHRKALVEAGHALHLDYAAPGADMLAALPGQGTATVRGTSFAAPLAAGRLAALMAADGDGARTALDREAVDLGAEGADPVYGRGLVCGECATRP